MFGLFENKQGKILIAEAERTLAHANFLKEKDKKKVAINAMKKILKCIKEMEGLPVPSDDLDNVIKEQVNEATRNRQKAMTSEEEQNPKWIETALIESFLQANCGYFGKTATQRVPMLIFSWLKGNVSEKDFNNLH